MIEQMRRAYDHDHLMRCTQYIGEMQGPLAMLNIRQPEDFEKVCSPQFLKLAYIRYVHNKMNHIKSALVSVFATKVMKIDSTFRIIKKLRGDGDRSASKCLTNITTETGEIMMFVVTEDESHGLMDMHLGIIRRLVSKNKTNDIIQ